MVRKRWILDPETKKLVPEEEYYRAPTGQAPGVIQDSMDATAHPCTGELMDSKSAFRRVTKAHGCVEVGSDKITPKPFTPSITKKDIIEAMNGKGRRS
jgi:hypothetical protein